MNSNKTTPASVHVSLASGATATAPFYNVTIDQTLCVCACADDTPIFTPSFSVISIESVGTSMYVIHINVDGVINYVPCGCGTCATRSQMLSQDFSVPVYSTTAINGATITAGTASNSIKRYSCSSCSKAFSSNIPVTINIETA